jgi:hypothetical protein
MEDIITSLFIRFSTREDAVDMLTILCAEFFRQDGRRNECSTPFAQSTPCWSGYYIMPDHEGRVPLLAPVMALQMMKHRFEHALAGEVAKLNDTNDAMDIDDPSVTQPPSPSLQITEKDISIHWTFLRALILVLLMYDGRMRRLFLASPNPFWPGPPPERARIFLAPGGPFQREVNGFLKVHPKTTSFKAAHTMAYDFVMRADAMWMNTVYAWERVNNSSGNSKIKE